MTGAELYQLSVDLATYAGAVSAGVSANALTDGAKSLIDRIRHRVPQVDSGGFLTVTPEMVDQIVTLLSEEPELLEEAARVMRGITIDRSIIVKGENVYGVNQTNN